MTATADPDTRCRSTPCQAEPQLWFASKTEDRAEAVAACRHCPALDWCRTKILPRELALTRRNRFGVVAGVDLEATTDTPEG